MDEVMLEHRLTALEAGQAVMVAEIRQGFDRMDVRLKSNEIALNGLAVKVSVQNGRIGELEHRPQPTPNVLPDREALELIAQHRDLWTAWRFGRWFVPLSIPAAVGIAAIVLKLAELVGG